MFNNLLAEMARKNPKITRLNIAKELKISEKTVRNYILGKSQIPWSYALKIKYTFFSDMEMEYLFKVDGNELDKSINNEENPL